MRRSPADRLAGGGPTNADGSGCTIGSWDGPAVDSRPCSLSVRGLDVPSARRWRPRGRGRGAFSLLELTITLITASIVMGGLLLLFQSMMATDRLSHQSVALYYLQQFGHAKIDDRLARATKIRAPDLTTVSAGKLARVITYDRTFYDDRQMPPDPPPSSPPPPSPTRLNPNYDVDYSLTGVVFLPISGSKVWLLERQPPGGPTGPAPTFNNDNLLAGWVAPAYRTTWRDTGQAGSEATMVWTFISTSLNRVDAPVLSNPSDASLHLEEVSGNVAAFDVQPNTGPFTGAGGGDVYAADYTLTFRDPEAIGLYE